jgi:hypothetical protein
LDFASQFGVRLPLPGKHVIGELTFRHWSDCGIRLPNHRRDFVKLTVRPNSGLVGVDRTAQITVDGLVDFKGALSANDAGAPKLP